MIRLIISVQTAESSSFSWSDANQCNPAHSKTIGKQLDGESTNFRNIIVAERVTQQTAAENIT